MRRVRARCRSASDSEERPISFPSYWLTAQSQAGSMDVLEAERESPLLYFYDDDTLCVSFEKDHIGFRR